MFCLSFIQFSVNGRETRVSRSWVIMLGCKSRGKQSLLVLFINFYLKCVQITDILRPWIRLDFFSYLCFSTTSWNVFNKVNIPGGAQAIGPQNTSQLQRQTTFSRLQLHYVQSLLRGHKVHNHHMQEYDSGYVCFRAKCLLGWKIIWLWDLVAPEMS